MITQFKLYIYGGLAVLIVGMAIAVNVLLASNKKMKAKIDRQENTITQLQNDTASYRHFEADLKEFQQLITPRLDSLMKMAKIKPKQVTNVTNINNTYINNDTTVITPPATITDKDTTYHFVDTKECFKVAGYMLVKENKPSLVITERSFINNIAVIAYWKRTHKFLGIQFGKKIHTGSAFSDCGEIKVDDIKVLKKE
jgi:hypothetical protein